MWNVDFCNMFPHIAVEDMNDLERTYLEMLQFNINVESSVYTKYYFDLRTLAEEVISTLESRIMLSNCRTTRHSRWSR